jgi:predicted dinucleotide-binding enzyme
MKIAIIGAGHVGGALAKGWAKAGHAVILGARNPQDEKIKSFLAANKDISAKSAHEAAREAEVILVALPIEAVVEVVKSLGELQDRIVIDATNAIFQKPAPYAHTVEAVKALTNCADAVKCFNSTGFENMANPSYGDLGIDMFVAGDSARGKEVAAQLARDLGFDECYDFGGDDKIALLEQFALCWINLAIMQKQGRGIAFKVLRR